MAASYVLNEHKQEYAKIKDIGFDIIIDLYVANSNMNAADIQRKFDEVLGENISIDEIFAKDLKSLISNGMLGSDYRRYFYNFPADSYLYNNKQERLANIILYDQDVSKDETFDEFVIEVMLSDMSVITNSFDRLNRLKVFYPNCIFYSMELFRLAITRDEEKVWDMIENKLEYNQEAISITSQQIMPIIRKYIIHNQEYINKLCDIFIRKAQAQALIVLRRNIIEQLAWGIDSFKALFFGACPLITKTEVDSLKNNEYMLGLINLDSPELGMELVKTIHASILTGMNLFQDDIFNKTADYYEKLYSVMGTIENDTITQYMFEIMQTSKTIHPKLEQIILANNSEENIIEQYKKLLCEVAKQKMLSADTLQNIETLGICEGLSVEVCAQLEYNKQYKTFLINASNSNIEIIDFTEEQIVNTINEIDFLNEDDKMVSGSLLKMLRHRILWISEETTVNHYRKLFMLPYAIITEEELESVSNKIFALSLIDSKQINADNDAYIANYLCRNTSDLNESYHILNYVSSIDDLENRKHMFLELDFNAIQYCGLSQQVRTNIVQKMSEAFDFKDLKEQILYMTCTKCTYSPFEKEIKQAIANKEFDDYNSLYAEYIRNVKRITNEMLSNLHAMNTWYSLPPAVLRKLYIRKYYRYYVVAKALYESQFVFEEDKLDVLKNAYDYVFFSNAGAFSNIKEYMANNFDFVTYMCDNKKYVGKSEYHRMLFVNCHQSTDCLQDLIDNFSPEFCVTYLSKIAGFKDNNAARLFVNIIKNNQAIASDDEVYKNNYVKLIDSDLKSNFTRYHNRAKKSV